MNSIKSPWHKEFDKFVRAIQNSVLIAAPYINRQPVERLVRELHSKDLVQIDVLTNLDSTHLINGSVDAGALFWLCQEVPGTSVWSLPRLHAKAYVADNRTAIVTSANFTNNGLTRNYELGVEISDSRYIDDLVQDLQEYKQLGCCVPQRILMELDQIAGEARRIQVNTDSSTRSVYSTEIENFLNQLDDVLVDLRTLPGESRTTIFGRAILYVLSQYGPLTTKELQPIIQNLYPDLCSEGEQRIINGVAFGSKWKHDFRNAQVSLKRSGKIRNDGGRGGKWFLIPQ